MKNLQSRLKEVLNTIFMEKIYRQCWKLRWKQKGNVNGASVMSGGCAVGCCTVQKVQVQPRLLTALGLQARYVEPLNGSFAIEHVTDSL